MTPPKLNSSAMFCKKLNKVLSAIDGEFTPFNNLVLMGAVLVEQRSVIQDQPEKDNINKEILRKDSKKKQVLGTSANKRPAEEHGSEFQITQQRGK